MKKVGVLYHPFIESARTLSEEIKQLLLDQGVSTWSCSAWDETNAINKLNGTELLLTVGGDGTILRAVQVAITGNIPITGINMGNLGFMTELSAGESKTELIKILEGKGWLDERSMLEVELPPKCVKKKQYALNDVVLGRGAIARIIKIETSIDGVFFTTYNADGIILSTSTGSTAYSLAAGGPILHPHAPEFILTPILPHLGLSNSHVLPANVTVKLRLKSKVSATISIDGHTNMMVSDNAEVVIKCSKKVTRFMRIHPADSFYRTLEQKLKGKITI
jgi:NAD+ kinase